MASWEQWVQEVGKSVIDKASDARYTQPYEIDKLRIQALGDLGLYQEGQSGTVSTAPKAAISTNMLLMGGLVLVFLLVKD